jgi:hypothetical protein
MSIIWSPEALLLFGVEAMLPRPLVVAPRGWSTAVRPRPQVLKCSLVRDDHATGALADGARQAVVVRMEMRDHDLLDVREVDVQRLQLFTHSLDGAGHAGPRVHEHVATLTLDKVDERVAEHVAGHGRLELMDTLNDLHESSVL